MKQTTLERLINLGVKELKVTNKEAVAVNPYDPEIWEEERAYNVLQRELNALPPLPCPSVENGTYEIGRFEEEWPKTGVGIWADANSDKIILILKRLLN